MPVPVDARIETRDAILDAAARRFARFGARKTTMDEVAREAGCSRATVYTHFRSKEALYRALLDRDTAAFLTIAQKVIAPLPDARRKLRRLVELADAAFESNPVARHALARDEEMTLVAIAESHMKERERRVISLLRDVLEKGVTEGSLHPLDPERVAYFLYHAIRALITQEATGMAAFPIADILGAAADVLDYGIAKYGGPTSGIGIEPGGGI